MEIKRALEILKNKNDYIVPTSDFDEAVEVAIEVMEEKLKSEVVVNVFNDAIKSDKIIDEFLRDREEK